MSISEERFHLKHRILKCFLAAHIEEENVHTVWPIVCLEKKLETAMLNCWRWREWEPILNELPHVSHGYSTSPQTCASKRTIPKTHTAQKGRVNLDPINPNVQSVYRISTLGYSCIFQSARLKPWAVSPRLKAVERACLIEHVPEIYLHLGLASAGSVRATAVSSCEVRNRSVLK